MTEPFAQMVRRVNGPGKDRIEGVGGSQYEVLEQLESLYNESPSAEFNEVLTKYMSDLTTQAEAGTGPVGWSPFRNRIELMYDSFSPFYMAMFLYLFGFVLSVAAWIDPQFPD